MGFKIVDMLFFDGLFDGTEVSLKLGVEIFLIFLHLQQYKLYYIKNANIFLSQNDYQ